MRKAFVIGWPIAHSLSPDLHHFWIDRHAIDGSYEKIPIEPKDLDSFIRGFSDKGFVGGNVTIPHKEEAFRLCDVTDDHANAIGATNTLWLENNCLFGSNTDSYGFSTNLDDQAPGWDEVDTALIFGAGGASRAIIHAIQQRKIPRILLANRTRSRAERLAAHFGPDVIPADMQEVPTLVKGAGLIVNTTSLGMTGHEPLEVNLHNAAPECVVSDLVYTPLETPLLAQARKLGLRTSDGLGMLLHQAVPGFAKWFGIEPEVDQALRDHVLEILLRRDEPKSEIEAG